MADKSKRCKTSNCHKRAIHNEDYCKQCLRIMADIQTSKMVPEMLKSLEKIKEILANNQLIVPTQTTQQRTTVNEETEIFIPTINVPDVEVKGDNTKQIETNETNLTDIAEKLNSIGD